MLSGFRQRHGKRLYAIFSVFFKVSCFVSQVVELTTYAKTPQMKYVANPPKPTYVKTPQMKYVANTRDQIKATRGYNMMAEAEAFAKLQWKALTPEERWEIAKLQNHQAAMREWSGSYLRLVALKTF
jgi:hypothetical protein